VGSDRLANQQAFHEIAPRPPQKHRDSLFRYNLHELVEARGITFHEGPAYKDVGDIIVSARLVSYLSGVGGHYRSCGQHEGQAGGQKASNVHDSFPVYRLGHVARMDASLS
jgi:hypothetical protein